MIQRIQTIYLLIVTILAAICCFVPSFHVNGEAIDFVALLPLSILSAVVPVVAFATIFLYKRRVLQMRISSFNIVLMLFQIAILVYQYITIGKLSADAAVSLSITDSFPLINIILTYLAIRETGKDEALVRSLDRLR